MTDLNILKSLSFDCLILVHPQVQVLESTAKEIQEAGIALLNISKALSSFLMTLSANERGRFSQKWLTERLANFQSGPVLCTCPDLLFEPSLKIDPLSLFRQAARIRQIIVLWPGEYSTNTLSYAVPEHQHFQTWKITDSLLRQPAVTIRQISTS